MDRQEIIFTNAVDIARMIQERVVTSEEVVLAFFEQIDKLNPRYNAIVTLNRENALLMAREADRDLANGRIHGKLHGVPVTIKDNYRTKGLRSTAGFRPLKNYIPKEDAAVVSLLRKEGAIILGKTNLPVLALDTQCFNQIFGRTNHPSDVRLTPGGSSGGCATALALGMTPLSFGNDLAGSIRVPAAFCGVYGFLPTWGTISLRGAIADPFEKTKGVRSIAAAGVLARSIEDIELGLDILNHPSENSRRLVPLQRYLEIPELKDLRIAWTDTFGEVKVDDEVSNMIKDYAEKLQNAGVRMEKKVPDLDFQLVWNTWGRMVGMLAGFSVPAFIRSIATFIFRRMIKNVPMLYDMLLPVSLKEYMKASATQDILINQFEKFLENYDAFIAPVTAIPAFPHKKPDVSVYIFNFYTKPLYYRNQKWNYYMATQSFTTPFNLLETPVLSIPIGKTQNGLPVGIQLIGKRYSDFRLLQAAKALR